MTAIVAETVRGEIRGFGQQQWALFCELKASRMNRPALFGPLI